MNNTITFHRDRFTWLAYLLLALYGYFINILGPLTPFLKDELGLSYTVSSLHFTAFAAGMLLVREAGGFVSDFRGGDRAIERSEFIAGSGAVHSKLQKLVAGALRNA